MDIHSTRVPPSFLPPVKIYDRAAHFDGDAFCRHLSGYLPNASALDARLSASSRTSSGCTASFLGSLRAFDDIALIFLSVSCLSSSTYRCFDVSILQTIQDSFLAAATSASCGALPFRIIFV